MSRTGVGSTFAAVFRAPPALPASAPCAHCAKRRSAALTCAATRARKHLAVILLRLTDEIARSA